jgi:hypothetical protein
MFFSLGSNLSRSGKPCPRRIKCIPKGQNNFLETYTAATAQPHGYLVIDIEARDTGHIETKTSYLSRGETDRIRRYLVIYPSLSKINSPLNRLG